MAKPSEVVDARVARSHVDDAEQPDDRECDQLERTSLLIVSAYLTTYPETELVRASRRADPAGRRRGRDRRQRQQRDGRPARIRAVAVVVGIRPDSPAPAARPAARTPGRLPDAEVAQRGADLDVQRQPRVTWPPIAPGSVNRGTDRWDQRERGDEVGRRLAERLQGGLRASRTLIRSASRGG